MADFDHKTPGRTLIPGQDRQILLVRRGLEQATSGLAYFRQQYSSEFRGDSIAGWNRIRVIGEGRISVILFRAAEHRQNPAVREIGNRDALSHPALIERYFAPPTILLPFTYGNSQYDISGDVRTRIDLPRRRPW